MAIVLSVLAALVSLAAAGGYKNVTIGAGSFNATVFLPPASPEEPAYYNGTRFDWSTQIGNILVGPHVVFGDNVWRASPQTEAGVGLAEEFGCGDAGQMCASGPLHYKAGAHNGVLGFDQAGPGEAFLKIGVGKLVKPSDAMPLYSPFKSYSFAEYPHWDIHVGADTVNMSQKISLNTEWCYRKNISVQVVEPEVRIVSYLQNCGDYEFSTPHYSHNFLSVDRRPIGPPWKMALAQDMTSRMEPGVGNGTVLMGEYFQPVPGRKDMWQAKAEMPEGAKIKALFIGERNLQAGNVWQASYGDLEITHTQTPKAPLYAYNLYVERGTLSPEPFQMLTVRPGEVVHWSRVLSFKLNGEAPPMASELLVV